MKLLFDQNLSFKLIDITANAFPDSRHVKDFDMIRASDAAVWSFAKENDFAIVSKDADFANLAFLHGQPPKLIYVRVGNCPTEEIRQLLLDAQSAILEFLNDPIESVLTLQ